MLIILCYLFAHLFQLEKCQKYSSQIMSTFTLNNSMKLLNLAWSNSDTHSNAIDNECDIVLLDSDVTDNIVNHWKKKGKLLMGYISVGSLEHWRSDAKYWPHKAKGKKMENWDEWWINLNHWKSVKPLMTKRIKKLKHRGFDMVEFDNICAVGEYNKGKGNKNISYAKWLSQTAKDIGILPVMKNGSEENGFILAKAVSDYFVAIIIEEALPFDSMYDYIKYKGKPIWMFEYHTKYDGAYSSKDKLINAILKNPQNMKNWVSQVSFDEGNGWENVFPVCNSNALPSNEINKNRNMFSIFVNVVIIIVIICMIIVLVHGISRMF
eukprot:396408_1